MLYYVLVQSHDIHVKNKERSINLFHIAIANEGGYNEMTFLFAILPHAP